MPAPPPDEPDGEKGGNAGGEADAVLRRTGMAARRLVCPRIDGLADARPHRTGAIPDAQLRQNGRATCMGDRRRRVGRGRERTSRSARSRATRSARTLLQLLFPRSDFHPNLSRRRSRRRLRRGRRRGRQRFGRRLGVRVPGGRRGSCRIGSRTRAGGGRLATGGGRRIGRHCGCRSCCGRRCCGRIGCRRSCRGRRRLRDRWRRRRRVRRRMWRRRRRGDGRRR